MTPRRPGTRVRPRRGERGVAAGLEGIVFGALILVAGTVVAVNAWSVLQTRRAFDGAAREYLRAYTEADDAQRASSAGRTAAYGVLAGERRSAFDTRAVRIEEPDAARFGPCEPATVVVSGRVPAARVPFVGSFASTTVRVAHTELVDAHREIRSGPDHDVGATPCGG